ncbi:hypothetical protein GCM10010182_57580 [Actinomadura cremea]|nr:hypothetical protein GCM10010182_57580 [Actinomadura cremea]
MSVDRMKPREKKPEMNTNTGMWNAYSTVYAAATAWLSPKLAQTCPTTTSTAAQNLALSK